MDIDLNLKLKSKRDLSPTIDTGFRDLIKRMF